MKLIITSGPCMVTHYCTLAEFEGRVGAALVGHYAKQADLDVHHAESHVVEVRRLRQTERAPRQYELRVAGRTVASAREAHPELRAEVV